MILTTILTTITITNNTVNMANYATLKAAIQQVIKTNGNNEITGALLQQSLLAMINSLGAGYQFMGVATPTTNPGTPDQNVFYVASEIGAYSNFGGFSVSDGEVAIFKYNGTWTKEVTGAATAEQVMRLVQEVANISFRTGEKLSTVNIQNSITRSKKDVVSSNAVYENTVRLFDDLENLLSVIDGEGEMLIKVNSGVEIDKDGNVKTSSFNSGNLSRDEETFALSFSDGEDIILGLNSGMKIDHTGNIKTKSFDSALPLNPGFSKFPTLDAKKEEFKWLDVGNSHSLCSLFYLKRIALSMGVDLSKVAFCRVSRGGSSFKSWVEGWHDDDTSGSGDQLTGGEYRLCKDFGGLSVKVTGNIYTQVAGTPTPVVDADVTNAYLTFWGGDCSILRSLLSDNKFDLITIHQRYTSNTQYDASNGWRDHSDDGYLTELIRIIKTFQPQACVGYLYSLLPWEYAGSNLAGVSSYYKQFSTSIKKFMANTGVDILLPCDTALENLRNSSLPDAVIEGTQQAGSVGLRYGFNYDPAHTAYGVAAYTMACVAWESILAQRYGKSCYGNTYRELISDDVSYTPAGSSTTLKYFNGSYTDGGGNKVMIDNGAYQAPQYIGCTSLDGGVTWTYSERAAATMRVADSNAALCQMAAILAVNDMWHINNPDNVEL